VDFKVIFIAQTSDASVLHRVLES